MGPRFWRTSCGKRRVARLMRTAGLEGRRKKRWRTTTIADPAAERARDLDDCMARMSERDHQYRYSVAWIDCLARGAALGRSLLFLGEHARRAEVPMAVPSVGAAGGITTSVTSPGDVGSPRPSLPS